MRGARNSRAASSCNAPAKEAPFDTLVVVMMENRSFDHLLGWTGTDAAYLDAGRQRYGANFTIDGNQAQTYVDAQGQEVATHWLPGTAGEQYPYQGCGEQIPGHGWHAARVQRDQGFLAKSSGNDPFVLGYYRASDMPFTEQLVRRFTTSDRSGAGRPPGLAVQGGVATSVESGVLTRMAALRAGGRGDVERGVAVEEPERREQEAGVLDRHHRPVLGPHEVGDTERVPEHDVGVDERPVGGRPAGQPVAALVLVRDTRRRRVARRRAYGVTQRLWRANPARRPTLDSGDASIVGVDIVGTSL